MYSALGLRDSRDDFAPGGLETQHAFGAIGYAEEHEAPRHFKRVHVDLLRHGGLAQARRKLAAYYLDATGVPFPRRTFGESPTPSATRCARWLDTNWDERRRTEFTSGR